MASNSRLAIAVHTLGVLTFAGDKSVSSEMIAGSVNTNPVVIRRIIRKFASKGIVEVRMGTGGGSRLTRPPEEITLAQIYDTLDEDDLFNSPELSDGHMCPIGKAVRPILKQVFIGIEANLRESLKEITLADVMKSVSESLAGGGIVPGKKC